jgi:hypothetical protein
MNCELKNCAVDKTVREQKHQKARVIFGMSLLFARLRSNTWAFLSGAGVASVSTLILRDDIERRAEIQENQLHHILMDHTTITLVVKCPSLWIQKVL